tara:strand:+ start:8855 stop:10096 length:1242 start_codon:yes stop_codon:yes gene_type:complete
MKYSRVYLYLNFLQIIQSLFKNYKKSKVIVEAEFKEKLNKENIHLTGMCRTAFLIVLEYLIKNYPQKKELIVCSYNLKELIDVARLKDFKIVFADVDKENGMIVESDVLNKINKNTAAVLFTNMFNDFSSLKKIAAICKQEEIIMIEDLAIYFGNHSNYKYAGSIGDVSILSFGIMKNISAFFGGALLTNNRSISEYARNRIDGFKNFPQKVYLKNIVLFIILKFFLSRIIYNFFFFYIIKLGSINNIFFINSKIYPALKFKKKNNIPSFYYSKISKLSVKIVHTIISSQSFLKSTNIRKDNNKFYFNGLKNLKDVRAIPIIDFDFQNFLDFPIIVKHKKELIKYLFEKGLETREHFYENCENLINNNVTNNASYYEKSLLCLPSHKKIKKETMQKYLDEIKNFYQTYKNQKN